MTFVDRLAELERRLFEAERAAMAAESERHLFAAKNEQLQRLCDRLAALAEKRVASE